MGIGRWVALVGATPAGAAEPWYVWQDVDGDIRRMPRPDVLLLEEDGRGGAVLFRYTARGEFGGDSRYESATAARRAAEMDFGENMDDWTPVPVDEPDAHTYAVLQASAKRRTLR